MKKLEKGYAINVEILDEYVEKNVYFMILGQSQEEKFSVSLCNNMIFIIFTNPSAQAGYDTRSIFKRSLTYSEYSLS